MAGKTWHDLERERYDRQRATRAAQSAERIRLNAQTETERRTVDDGKTAERAAMLDGYWQLKQNDPRAFLALPESLRLDVARHASEQQGRGGRQNRSAGALWSGPLDPRFERLAELRAADPQRYEIDMQRLSAVDKIAFGRYLRTLA